MICARSPVKVKFWQPYLFALFFKFSADCESNFLYLRQSEISLLMYGANRAKICLHAFSIIQISKKEFFIDFFLRMPFGE